MAAWPEREMRMPQDRGSPTDREILVNALGVYHGTILNGIAANELSQRSGEAHEKMLKDLRAIANRVKDLKEQVRIGDLALGH